MIPLANVEDRHDHALAGRGIEVRVLGAAHGIRPGALRIAAPRVDERQRFAAELREVAEELG